VPKRWGGGVQADSLLMREVGVEVEVDGALPFCSGATDTHKFRVIVVEY